MSDDATLSDTQRTLARALASTVEQWPGSLLHSVIPGGSLDCAGALAVYRNGYLARLSEQLGETYASVWRVLGDEDFFALCHRYIAGHASSSYNLSDYGHQFAAFLEHEPETVQVPFLPELARFELIVHELFHHPTHVAVETAQLASLGDLEGATMTLGSAVRLVACRYAVYDVFRHRDQAEPPDIVVERPQSVLLFKQDGEVLAREIDSASFAALEALASGLVVEEAVARAVECDAGYGAAEIARLFELIARCGLVAGIGR